MAEKRGVSSPGVQYASDDLDRRSYKMESLLDPCSIGFTSKAS